MNLDKIQDKIQNLINDIFEEINSIDQKINQTAIDFALNGTEESWRKVQEKIKSLNSSRDMLKGMISIIDDSENDPDLDHSHDPTP